MVGVPQDVLSETYLIKYVYNCGTAFRVCVGNNHYLITAKHNSPGIQSGDKIGIFYKDDWKLFQVKLISCENTFADMIALETKEHLKNKQSTLIPAGKDFYLGQDVFLIGFPEPYIKLKLSTYCQVNDGYPIPFARKCI